VDEDDKVEDIGEFIQKQTNGPKRFLDMEGVVHNQLDYAMQVRNWEHFDVLRNIALSEPVPRFGEDSAKQKPEVTEWEFIWVRTTPQLSTGSILTDLETNSARCQQYVLHCHVRRVESNEPSRARNEEHNLCDELQGQSL
jgi:hypothetical protein